MNQPEQLALHHALAVCVTHREALEDALADLRLRNLTADDLRSLSKGDRRLLDQFAYRYTRLQDDLGARLMPAVLRALQEDVGPMSVRDRLDRLEQLGWLPSAEAWLALRRMRNAFTHDYPLSVAEQMASLLAAMTAAYQLLAVLAGFEARSGREFPGLHAVD